ncbi:hypothetical protein OCS_00248 [Ophiocordyceps sinensis CO18]|nr:hypothetical protein OCS_00248 [Ophiocordyceps sinensis CO18]
MAIPGRCSHHGAPEQSSTSLWSIMGTHDKVNTSSSLGSTPAVGSDTSTSSDDEDAMDQDMDEAYVTTPMAKTSASMAHAGPGGPFGSPAMSSLMSFQQRQRPRKHPKKKVRGPLGLGFNLSAVSLSNSPPNSSARARRESISWQANQLHISGAETEEGTKSLSDADGGSGDGQRNVTRRPVTRRGNLLPKTKTFARIRAALAEEGAPADTETRREAEVVKQVRERDLGSEPRFPPPAPEPLAPASELSSPNLMNQESVDDIPDDDMMGDLALGLSSSFKQHAMKNSRGKTFWDTFSESSSMGGARTSPPPAAFLPRGSSPGMSEDTAMDSPSLAGPTGYYSGSQRGGTPGPSVAEISRRINHKRRRDDDLDPVSFKRRAVSPAMSVHNSPILQSPMPRDSGPWGSRSGSTGGDKGGSSAPSETGSMASTPANPSVGATGRLNGKGRVGFQGMIDTNDGIMRMSIE